ncbi:MAG: periplasmic heavy metal sensor [Bacteroidetes bacterium]|nr:periplasmic heavy metal sensor [Bacteroidota bacterium]
MNFFSKNQYVLWFLIFLVVIILSAFITLIVFFSNKSTIVQNQPAENACNAFRNELALSPAQSEKVEIILAEYRNSTDAIVADIRNHRILILDELAKKKPDTTLLNSYVEEISSLQKRMQKASVNQYLALKEICTPVQCQRLSTIYYELYGYQGQGKGEGKGRRYRGGRGQ